MCSDCFPFKRVLFIVWQMTKRKSARWPQFNGGGAPVILVAVFAGMITPGCAKTSTGGTTPAGKTTDSEATDSTPGEKNADVAYYEERAAALASESPVEIVKTDFIRLRRAWLYLEGAMSQDEEKLLSDQLTAAFEKRDDPVILEITAKILAGDQADIRAHMLRAVVLRRNGHVDKADFHRAVAIGLIESIMGSGNGRRVESAWTVFRVKEEYEILKVVGCVMKSQRLVSEGDRNYDVIEAQMIESGEMVELWFDISEIFAVRYKRMFGE